MSGSAVGLGPGAQLFRRRAAVALTHRCETVPPPSEPSRPDRPHRRPRTRREGLGSHCPTADTRLRSAALAPAGYCTPCPSR